MYTRISINKYIKILNYYNVTLPKTNDLIKSKAEKILNEHICRCIKSPEIKSNKLNNIITSKKKHKKTMKRNNK